TELLHLQCVSSNALYALAAKQALGLPLVLTAQGERTMDAAQIYQRWPFMARLLRRSLAAADHVTACSAATLEDLEQFAGHPLGPHRAEVIYNGIAPGDFADARAEAHPRPYVLAVGRFVPQKGFDLLLRAYAQAGLPEHELVLAGEGPERESLQALADRLGVQERVCFTGRVDRRRAAALFKGCAFFVLPSRQEPQGIVNLEAMAAGKAVVATRVGGVPEVVLDHETGLLVPGEDVPALAAALRRLAARPDLRSTLGAAGRQRAERFTWSHIADQYARIYAGLLTRVPAGATARLHPAELAMPSPR
ncbi:MAG: glycosyltransferase family 4 protein, partial [Gluconacetobacter diazotrophicus]|nr:glycosyltransferase family 4 protein [Gluconacetobacter diazotrophicus]